MPSKAYPIEWHESRIKNEIDYSIRVLEQAKLILKQYVYVKKRVNFYKYQIEEAKRQERETFDRERFCIKRKKEDEE